MLDLVRDPALRRCMIIGCGLVFFQQFTGQPNVLYYGATILKTAGFTSTFSATLASVSLAVAKVSFRFLLGVH